MARVCLKLNLDKFMERSLLHLVHIKFSRVAVTVYVGTLRRTFSEQGHVSGIVVEILHVTVIQS